MTRSRTTYAILLSLLMFLAIPVIAQDTGAVSTQTSAQVTAADIQELRQALAAQQQQIAAQREEIERLRGELRNAQQQMTQQLAEVKAAQQPSSTVVAATASAVEPTMDASKVGAATVASATQQHSQTPSSAIESGFGRIRFNGLLQVWASTGDTGYRDSFRIRRTELKFSGQITDKARWTVMIDPSKSLSLNNSSVSTNGVSVLGASTVNQASRILQDAFLSADYIPHVRVDVGQFKIPLSLESSESSAGLATLERALFMSDRARGGSFGDIRDIGVMVSAPVTKYVDVYLGEFNSSGDRQNDVAVNDQKATVGRLVIKPVKWLQIGGSGAYGNGGSRADRPRRDRIGAELLLRTHGFTLKSEYMQGKDANVLRQGYYALASYRLRRGIEPVFRFDTFDPDVSHLRLSAATAPERDFIAGFNWYLSDTHFKIQTNYIRKKFAQEIVPTRNLLFVGLQTAW